MRTMLAPLIGFGLALGLAAAWPAQARSNDRPRDGDIVRCESNDGRSRQCHADARGGARLLRQLSRSPCIEGRTWGVLRDGIWVSNGCRGEFLVEGGRGRYRNDRDHRRPGPPWRELARGVRCESRDGRWNRCEVDTRGGVRLTRQLSRSACIHGRSWGSDRRGIWVSGGCRAEFEVGMRR